MQISIIKKGQQVYNADMKSIKPSYYYPTHISQQNQDNLKLQSPLQYRQSHNRQAEVIEDSLLEHLLRFPPTQPFLLHYFIKPIPSCVMRIQDQKLTLSQLPSIIDTDYAVCVLSAAVHDRTSYFLKMVADCFALLNDLLAVTDVQDPAVKVSQMFDHPRHLSCADPFPSISKFLPASEVDAVDQLLDLGDGKHLWEFQVVLKGEPGEQGLETAVGTTPTVVVEVLVTIVEVFIQASRVVLQVLVLLCSFDEEMRVVEFLRREGNQLSRRGKFAIVERLDYPICLFVDQFSECIFGVNVEIEIYNVIQ